MKFIKHQSTKTALRVALLGCGRWGKNLAKNLHRLGVLSLIVDAYPSGVERYAAELDVDLSGTPDAAFSDEIDAVVIAAPAVDHYRLAKKALLAGKATFVEKPLALKIEEAVELGELANELGLTLMIGHLLQYHPAFVAAKNAVTSGVIGDLRHINSNRLNPGRIRTEENALWSMAPHDFSMVLSLAGREPERISTLATTIVDPNLPDQYSIQFDFSKSLTAQVNVSWLSPFKEHKLVLLGSKGALVFEDSAPDRDRKLVLYDDYVDMSGEFPQFRKGEGVPLSWENTEPLFAELSAFVSAVVDDTPVPTGPDEAIPVLRLLHQAEASRIN